MNSASAGEYPGLSGAGPSLVFELQARHQRLNHYHRMGESIISIELYTLWELAVIIVTASGRSDMHIIEPDTSRS